MVSKKSVSPPATLDEAINNHADRFYRMFRINTASKMVMTALAVLGVSYSAYNIYSQYEESNGNRDHIAVIKISGEMGTGNATGDGNVIATAIGKAYHNPHVKAVLIEAESGGGGPSDASIIYRQLTTVRDSHHSIKVTDANSKSPIPPVLTKQVSAERQQEVRQHVLSLLKDGAGNFDASDRNAYKPIIVSVKTLCASACYYAASGADAIYADGNALIGSIGVRMDHWDVSRVMDTVGVKNVPLISGTYKDALDPYHPLTTETRDFMQTELLNKMHATFIADVERGRKGRILPAEKAEEIGLYSGRIWLAPTAAAYGLIDAEVTPVDIRNRLSVIYGTEKFKVYNEKSKDLRSMIGLSLDAISGTEKLISFADKLDSRMQPTSTPQLR